MFILTKKEISTIVTVQVMDLLFKNNPTLLTQITLVNKHTDLKKNEQGNVKTITMNKN